MISQDAQQFFRIRPRGWLAAAKSPQQALVLAEDEVAAELVHVVAAIRRPRPPAAKYQLQIMEHRPRPKVRLPAHSLQAEAAILLALRVADHREGPRGALQILGQN